MNIFPTSLRMLQASRYLRYIQVPGTFCTFAVTLHFLVYSSTFSVCFCNPSGVSDIPTKSSTHINPDTVYFLTVTPCFAASTATIMSLIHTLNTLGDSVHPCATLCKISTYCSSIFPIQHHSTPSTFCHIFFNQYPHISSDPNFPHISTTHSSTLCRRSSVHLERNSTLLPPRRSYLELPYILCTHGLRDYGLA